MEEKIENQDELDEIFVDKNIPADKKILIEILKPFVTIDNESTLSFTERYYNLNENLRVLVYLCSKKAMVLRALPNIAEESGPTEVYKNAQVTENSAKHAIYRDFRRILSKQGNGFIIPNYNLRKARDLILNNNGKTEESN